MGVQFQLQMSWQPSLLSHKRKTGPPLGLRNLGNSCYLNSVLQCLTYTPPLANFCLRNQHTSLCDSSDAERKRDCPFCILEKRIVRSLSLDLSLDAPLKIQSCLRIFAEHFRCGRQEDAHEFLRYVIDACHNTCLRLKKLRRNANGNGNAANCIGNGAATTTSTVVKEIFGGALQSQVKCLSCGTESNKVDEIMDISLDVLNSNSLKDALQKFFQPELLDGQNKYKCESCNKLVAARKQMSILQAPNVLVIQLKRFEGIFGGKIDKSIAFEEFLVLSSFMCKASQDLRPEYKLFGTIVHSGFSPESGHYYAYIKDAMGRWYCCNDSFVSLSTMQEVLTEKVYVLFFSRTNQRPALASTASNGVSSRDCNGREASKPPKTALPPKGAQPKPSEQSSSKDSSAIPKVDKVPPGPRMKFNINGSSNSKRAPATDNGKIAHRNQSLGSNGERTPATDNGKITHKDESVGSNGEKTLATDNRILAPKSQLLGSNGDTASTTDNGKTPYKNQSIGLNGDPKDPVILEKVEKAKTSLINRGGATGDKKVDIVDGNNTQQSLLSRENGSIASVRTEVWEDIGTRGSLTAGKVPDHSELDNSGLHGHSHVSGSKRNSQDSCILFAHDAQSRAEVEGLKEILKKEASSVLRSCGWSDKVYSFMCSRKRLCAQKVGTAQNSCEVKKLLIADSKSTFLSQIPESLRGDLVSRIQSFSQK